MGLDDWDDALLQSFGLQISKCFLNLDRLGVLLPCEFSPLPDGILIEYSHQPMTLLFQKMMDALHK